MAQVRYCTPNLSFYISSLSVSSLFLFVFVVAIHHLQQPLVSQTPTAHSHPPIPSKRGFPTASPSTSVPSSFTSALAGTPDPGEGTLGWGEGTLGSGCRGSQWGWISIPAPATQCKPPSPAHLVIDTSAARTWLTADERAGHVTNKPENADHNSRFADEWYSWFMCQDRRELCNKFSNRVWRRKQCDWNAGKYFCWNICARGMYVNMKITELG